MPRLALIRKSAEPFGWMGNMSRFPVVWQEKCFPTSEHLFQCLRFSDPEIIEHIRAENNPMKAKWFAKGKATEMTVEPLSLQDVQNMLMVLKLKLEQHPELKEQLIATEDAIIIEDCTKRQGGSGLFWGAALKENVWTGRNMLGKLWMKLRTELIPGTVEGERNESWVQ